MKKYLRIVAICAAVTVLCFALSACSPKKRSFEEFDADFTTYSKASGLSAYTLMNTAYDNLINDKAHSWSEYFEFSASALGGMNVATQNSTSERKYDGEKIYLTNVKIGTGQGKANNAQKFYYDGNKAYAIDIENDKSKVPAKGEGDERFAVTDFGKFGEFTGKLEDFVTTGMNKEQILEYKLNELKTRMCFYNMTDKKYLSANHDDNVYHKGSKYYFTVTFDCSKDAMDNYHTEAKAEFIRALGIADKDIDSFVMTSDTTIKFIVEKVGKTYRFSGWQRHEAYKGKVGVEATADQVCTVFLSYDKHDYTINSDDLSYLA